MNSEWIDYEKGARERAESVRRSEDPAVREAIDAVDARKRELRTAAIADEINSLLAEF
jgi:hypothetical protein